MGEAMSDDDEEDIGAFSLAVEKIMDRRQTRRSVVAGPMPGAAGSGAVLGGAGRGGTDAGGGVAGHGDGDNADAILASAHALAAALQESAEVGYFPELPDEVVIVVTCNAWTCWTVHSRPCLHRNPLTHTHDHAFPVLTKIGSARLRRIRTGPNQAWCTGGGGGS